jgi:hypothetical protein
VEAREEQFVGGSHSCSFLSTGPLNVVMTVYAHFLYALAIIEGILSWVNQF